MLKMAVIGCPIGHSRSPQIHGAVLESLNIEYQYEKIEVKNDELQDFLQYAKENLDGFNLTMPLKIDVLPYLDSVSEEAKAFASVNTVKVEKGKFYGYNTDSDGYIQALLNNGCNPENKNVVVLGAGGAARTLVKKLVKSGAKNVTILNRTVEKAEETAKSTGSDKVGYGGFTTESISWHCREADLLINATPIGMEGNNSEFEDTSFLKALPKTALVSDLIYAPPKTKLLKDAEELGLKVMNGFDMLVFQAILADEIYIGKKLDLNNIYKNVIDKI